MSLVTASIVRTLRAAARRPRRQRRASCSTFVDNRQDASLQAGHFNDFVQVTQLRGALYRALHEAGVTGFATTRSRQQVTEALGLPMADFAQKPDAKFTPEATTRVRALREVTGYRLYLDLERGWRVTMPNLEQTGCSVSSYRDLPRSPTTRSLGRRHPALRDDEPEHREEIAAVLLDEFRRNLRHRRRVLTEEGFDAAPAAVRPAPERAMGAARRRERPRPSPASRSRGPARAGGQSRGTSTFRPRRSSAGSYPRRTRQPARSTPTTPQEIIEDLFSVLSDAGLLARGRKADGDDAAGYRLRAGAHPLARRRRPSGADGPAAHDAGP